MNAKLETVQLTADDWQGSDKGRQIRDGVRELLPLIRKNALEGEQLGMVHPETMQALQKTGLFLASVPTELGGYGLGARDLAEILTEVAQGDGGTAWVTMIASGHTRIALTLPERAIAEIYEHAATWPGPTIAGGSLFSEKIQKAEKTRDAIIVKAGGKWMFASGSKHAAFAAVGIDFEEEGERRRGMVLLTRDQYEIVDDWHVMGMSASSSNSLTTTRDIEVPLYRFLDLSKFPERLGSFRSRYAGLGFQLNALGVMLTVPLEMNCAALGVAKAAYEAFIAQAKARKPFNLPYASVADAPATQIIAGKVGAKIRAAQALLMKTADKIDQRAKGDGNFEPAEESEAIIDMVFAGNLCGEAIDAIQYAIGSATVSDMNPIQRYVRDVRVILTHGSLRFDPAAEINGRHVMGLPPFSAFAGGLPGVSAKAPEDK
ncbi:acyl-CoA dehydrogenase family protein [Paraburkholderia sp. J67]|uniref:acyl-CoA dehydrogenase family protein n=1 Tax=Paraburkholderia sp. J67 TaxID=2805435 RepID=UPI002ABD2E3E|nr:acyl-CoA dehydrogenase family protein [Paraburkholderia sp. J67]